MQSSECESEMGRAGASVVLLLTSFLLLSLSFVEATESQSRPILFNFGDSNSDTGGLVAGLGFPVDTPNGRSFFSRSTGRLSDGRLVIDFLCQSLNSSYLSPYLDSLGSNFTNGVNFAIVGSSTLPKYVPFALNIQVMQFLHFKSHLLGNTARGYLNFMDEQVFRSALYMIDIGQNDLADAFTKNSSYSQVVERMPLVLAEIKSAIKTIYQQGGKNFWIHNTGPLGCLPQKLAMESKDKVLDSYGCIQMYNDAAKAFNGALRSACEELKSELKGVTIVYVDIYSIKYDLVANHTKYGFENPLMACCGFGGPPYNYNIDAKCGNKGSNVCKEGSRYISWDGTHYTEFANYIVASNILSTNYSTPRLKFDHFFHFNWEP